MEAERGQSGTLFAPGEVGYAEYISNRKSYYQIRNECDCLCRELGKQLEVIKKFIEDIAMTLQKAGLKRAV